MKLRIEHDEYPESPRDWDNVGTMVCWHRRYTLGDEQPSESPEDWLNNLADSFLDDIPERVERAANYFYGTASRFGDVAEEYLKRARDEALNGTSETDVSIVQMRAANRRTMLEHEKQYLENLQDKPPLVEERIIEINTALARISQDLAREVARIKALIGKGNVIMLPLYLYDHSGITMNTGGFSCPWDSGQVGYIYVTMEDARKEWSGTDEEIRAKALTCLEAEVKVYDQYLTGDVYGYIIEDDDGEIVDSCWGFYEDEYCREAGEEAMKFLMKEAA